MISTQTFRELNQSQRAYFNSGATRPLAFRRQQLKTLRQLISNGQEAIIKALASDLGKPGFESYLAEIYASLKEIDHAHKNLPRWLQSRAVAVDIEAWPGVATITPEPLGVVLIISPWNYPFSLTIAPLVGAIAAGNCAILKPSEHSSATSQLLAQWLNEAFPAHYLQVVTGDAQVSQQLLQEKFDHIFFTGGTQVGQKIMLAAAQNLTPVTLELGGKSPCIVDTDIDLVEAAKRIVWGKFINAGQTCIAPDYLLVQESIYPQLIGQLQKAIAAFYGAEPRRSPDYGRIINRFQLERLVGLLKEGKIITGGDYLLEENYLAPTLMTQVNLDGPLMNEEIFGPILPILSYKTLAEAIAFVQARPKPLALYLFSQNQDQQNQVLTQTSAGGVCLNDTILQVGIIGLPFGGVGASGIGSYHGRASFDTFSHAKSILKKPFRWETNLRYPPYGNKLSWVKKFFR